jgi:hypothetical protein
MVSVLSLDLELHLTYLKFNHFAWILNQSVSG